MGLLLAIAIFACLGYWAYSAGKRTGSRGGFRAGWQKGSRIWRRGK